ncbi:hypothetical protein, partial [Adhaeribacter aerolatus]|uniref:hypothetical protein n=1 Tax=Adhaeribacter aerolatus TaxID=670289 RepID=UPI001C3FF525
MKQFSYYLNQINNLKAISHCKKVLNVIGLTFKSRLNFLDLYKISALSARKVQPLLRVVWMLVVLVLL